jgi:predicted nucleic acid-binding protein
VAVGNAAAKLARMKRWLLDTGPLVAYLDGDDAAHRFVAEKMDGISGECCTTSAVITEAMHLLAEDSRGPGLLLEFVLAARVKIHESTGIRDLRQAVALMTKYGDIPMDFADATLMLLAEKIKTTDICTLDRRGFSAYRTASGKALRLLLDLT